MVHAMEGNQALIKPYQKNLSWQKLGKAIKKIRNKNSRSANSKKNIYINLTYKEYNEHTAHHPLLKNVLVLAGHGSQV